MQGKHVLIAGGTGLVGTNLTKRLILLEANLCSSYFSSQPEEDIRDYYKHFDFTKFEDCLEATQQQDYVIICAAQVFGAQKMKENPTIAILPNLQINAGLLEACSRNGVKKVIFISSTTVYHEANYPIREEELDLNRPPYELYQGVGWLNRYLEQLALFYYKTKGLELSIIRPTNIYGPYDQFDDDKSHVLPALIKRAILKETPYIVWGNGHTLRDFIYVEDFIEILLEVLAEDCGSSPINVGYGRPISIRDAVKIILKVCEHHTTPWYDPTKPNAIPYRAVSTTKCDALFGKKRKTEFEIGIQKTLDWYKSVMADG